MTARLVVLLCQYLLVILSAVDLGTCYSVSSSGPGLGNDTTNITTATDNVWRNDSVTVPTVIHEESTVGTTGQPGNHSDAIVTRTTTPVGDQDHLGARKKELPMAIIIAGPAAAVSVVLFVCVAYYCHTVQLDNRAKRLAVTMFIGQSPGSNSRSLGFTPLHPPTDGEAGGKQGKDTLAVPSLSVPPNIQIKRGSSWSAIADQEILNLASPRRHSTFIL